MTKWLCICLCICAFTNANAQVAIQIHGRIISAPAEQMSITVWCDGELVAKSTERGLLYAIQLGEKPHYTLKFESAGVVKYCHIVAFNMGVEDIPVDVDFRSKQSVILIKKSSRQDRYTLLRYGVGASIQEFDLIGR